MEDHCQSVDTQAPSLKKSITINYYVNMHCGQLVDIDIQNTAHGMFIISKVSHQKLSHQKFIIS